MLARARRDLERLRRRQLLVHAAQHLVGPGLGAEEDHAQPGARDPAPRRVLEAEQRVDARLAPPREAERLDALAQLERVVLLDEEVVVVEMHAVHAVLLDEPAEVRGRAGRRLQLLAAAEHGDHAAEAAAVRAADGRLVDPGAAAEERRHQVVVHRDLLVGRRRQLVRPHPLPLRPDHVRAVVRAEREPGDRAWVARAVQHLEQLAERVLALPTDHVVHVRRVQHRRRVEAGEVAAPHDRQVRVALLDPPGQRDRAHELRPGHHRHRDGAHGVGGARTRLDPVDRIVVRIHAGPVAVHDLPRRAFRQRGADRHDGQREAAVLRARGPRVHEQDHGTVVSHRSKREGGRRRRSRAISGRSS